jgi:lipopolysaccharide/colanic/teichoic acid biosynthesis glycosyltransferase
VNKATLNYSTQVPRWKRTLDVFAVLVALPLVIPLALVIAALIRSVSAGPVLFRQERVGYWAGDSCASNSEPCMLELMWWRIKDIFPI